MNKVYKDFITSLIEEIVRENKKFSENLVESQESLSSLVRKKRIR